MHTCLQAFKRQRLVFEKVARPQQGVQGIDRESHALQGMMQVHQGMQYGAPPASVYQPQQQYVPIPQHQQNEQLRQFWLQQAREIQEVGTDPAEFKNHQLPLARIKKASFTIAHFQCRIGAKILSSFIFIDRVKVRVALYKWSKDTAQFASHLSTNIVKDGASDADHEERRGCEDDQCRSPSPLC